MNNIIKQPSFLLIQVDHDNIVHSIIDSIHLMHTIEQDLMVHKVVTSPDQHSDVSYINASQSFAIQYAMSCTRLFFANTRLHQ